MHWAVYSTANHDPDCIDVLLGVDNVHVNERDVDGKTALDFAYDAYEMLTNMEKEKEEIDSTISKLILAGGVRGLELKSTAADAVEVPLKTETE